MDVTPELLEAIGFVKIEPQENEPLGYYMYRHITPFYFRKKQKGDHTGAGYHPMKLKDLILLIVNNEIDDYNYHDSFMAY